ncbi:MAG: class I SAM-dependent methyltransferase [Bacteroidota bacterium]
MQCRICLNTNDNKEYVVKEMMFGTQDEFKYFQCSECGCLQICDFPQNIDKYYPDNYYSYGINSHANFIKRILKNTRNKFAITGKGIIGRVLNMLLPNYSLVLLRNVLIDKSAKILDVGCGDGALLYDLNEIGYKKLLGIDPYIENDIIYQNGLSILKKSIFDLYEKYDLIMFHHSFEHINEQFDTLKKVKELLEPDGLVLICVPTVSSYAWEKYKENWVQLDAPRHYFLHSTNSMRILSEKCGFAIKDIQYVSSEFQFIGSEQYLRGIPLVSENSFYYNKKSSIIKRKEILYYKKKAQELNKIKYGDTCAFILKPI